MIKNVLILATLCFIVLSTRADNGLTVVAVGEAELEKDQIVFAVDETPSSASAKTKKMINEVQGILSNDFAFYKHIFSVNQNSDAAKNALAKKYSSLAANGARYFIVSSFEDKGSDSFSIEAKLYGVNEKEELAAVTELISASNLRKKGHKITDLFYRKMTGKASIFSSRIIFVTDRDSTSSKEMKELYVMDFDGQNARRLTWHEGNVISPAFSFDGKKVLYSLIKNNKSKSRNVNLYVLNIETGQSSPLSTKKGINSGAFFMPDGQNIALTMTHQGNAEIYALNLATRKTRRITKHYAPDVDPSINSAGTKMAFLSGRSGTGRPMIYLADPRGQEKSVKRISFVGKFNATPRFSPDGSEIAFSSWLDNRFDIFRIDENGANLARLTKDFGSNEDPTFSNDGEFIGFSSQRVISSSKAVQNIYIMTREGDVLGQVTENFGNCSTPRWSKY